jgi:hypothetical protein
MTDLQPLLDGSDTSTYGDANGHIIDIDRKLLWECPHCKTMNSHLDDECRSCQRYLNLHVPRPWPRARAPQASIAIMIASANPVVRTLNMYSHTIYHISIVLLTL